MREGIGGGRHSFAADEKKMLSSGIALNHYTSGTGKLLGGGNSF